MGQNGQEGQPERMVSQDGGLEWAAKRARENG